MSVQRATGVQGGAGGRMCMVRQSGKKTVIVMGKCYRKNRSAEKPTLPLK